MSQTSEGTTRGDTMVLVGVLILAATLAVYTCVTYLKKGDIDRLPPKSAKAVLTMRKELAGLKPGDLILKEAWYQVENVREEGYAITFKTTGNDSKTINLAIESTVIDEWLKIKRIVRQGEDDWPQIANRFSS